MSIVFIQASVNEHLDHFYLLVILNRAKKTFPCKYQFEFLLSDSFWYCTYLGVELLKVICKFTICNFKFLKFTRNHLTIYHKGCTILYSLWGLFPRQERWSELPFPSPVDLPASVITHIFPEVAGRFFTTEPLEKPHIHI